MSGQFGDHFVGPRRLVMRSMGDLFGGGPLAANSLGLVYGLAGFA